jgi:hypothetical protein
MTKLDQRWVFSLYDVALGKKQGAQLAHDSEWSIISIDGHPAVVGSIEVQGHRCETLLTRGSFNKTIQEQTAYAAKLGYRLASRQEHKAYITTLLENERNNTNTKAEEEVLGPNIQDATGCITFTFSRVSEASGHHPTADPYIGALFVRASNTTKNQSLLSSLLGIFRAKD